MFKSIQRRITNWQRRRLFLRIYFAYLQVVKDDRALVLASIDFSELDRAIFKNHHKNSQDPNKKVPL